MALKASSVTPTLAVTDLDEARRFYGEVLGLQEEGEQEPGEEGVMYRVGECSTLYLYERPTPSGSSATACSFDVEDVQETVRELREAGVKFEEYDLPDMGIKTEGGVAKLEDFETAWFKDPSGNILAIDNMRAVRERRRARREAAASEDLHA